MEALYKCPVSTCFHPTCKRLMPIMTSVTQDMHGNPLYTAVCDKMGEVITDIRKCELIYPEKKPEKNEIEPLAEEIADKIVDRIPKVIETIPNSTTKQSSTAKKKYDRSSTKNWTQKDAAALIGISPRQIRSYKTNPPKDWPGWEDPIRLKKWKIKQDDDWNMSQAMKKSLSYKEGITERQMRK